MPVVRSQRQVQDNPLPGVRKTAAETATSMGAGAELAKAQVGGSLGQLGGTIAAVSAQHMGAIVQKERDRADDVALLKAQNQVDAWRSKRLFDPKTGALGVRGEESLGLPEQVNAEYDELTSQIEATLNPRQRDKFLQVKSSRGIELDLTLRRHVMGEMDKFEQEELTSKVRNSVNSAIANAQDPKMIGEELDRAIGAIKLHGKNLGMGPEAIEGKVREVTSTTHEGVIEQLLSLDKDKAAKVYFEETRGQIAGTSIAKIEKALDEGTLRGESQKQADAIIAKGGTLTDQRAAAREIDDAKLRDQVMTRIEHDASVRDRETREQDETRFNGAYNMMEKAGGNILAIPPAQWSQMSPAEKSSLRSEAERIAKGPARTTNQEVWADLMLQAGTNPAKFVTDVNLLTYRDRLSNEDFQQLVQIKANIAKGNFEAAQKSGLGDFETNRQVVDRTLEQFGIPTSGKEQTPEHKAAAAQLYRLVADDMKVEAERTKKAPDQAFVQAAADRIISAQVQMDGPSAVGAFFGRSPMMKRAIDLTVKDVPADEAKRITGELQRRGWPVNDQVILDYYIRARVPRRGGQ